VERHGQFARELGPVYIQYGRALLTSGINKQDTLLNKGAMPEGILLDEDAIEDGTKRRKLIELDSDEEEVAMEEGNAEGEEEEEEDDLQLAWEIFDIARIVYSDAASVDAEAKSALAEVYTDLGDVAMETESFSQAASDYWRSIELWRELLAVEFPSKEEKGCERTLASSYFKHAMALEYDNRAAEAVHSLDAASSVLSKRLQRLRGEDDDKGKDAKSDSDENEIEEIDGLLNDVKAKIEDVKAAILETLKVKDDKSVAEKKDGEIKDLSGLVRKRPIEQAEKLEGV